MPQLTETGRISPSARFTADYTNYQPTLVLFSKPISSSTYEFL